MSAPTMMIFPANGQQSKRSLVLRNPTNKDLIVKLIPSDPKVVVLEGVCVLVQARKYDVLSVTFDQTVSTKSQTLHIYTRPIEKHNHSSIKEWILIKDGREQCRNKVAQLKLVAQGGFSAQETIIDLPGKACLIDPAVKAVGGVDEKDTLTCQPIDGDTATAQNMSPEDIAAVQMKQEKSCWLFGPLVDLVFPPAQANASVNHEQNYTPCAGAS